MVLVLFATPPLLHQRALVWFITIAPWVSLPAYGAFLAERRPRWWSSVPTFRKTLLAGAMAGFALLWSHPVQKLLDPRQPDPAKSLSDGTPWEAALALDDSSHVGQTTLSQRLTAIYPGRHFTGTVFASETLGDFFLWRMKPPVPVFIYSHVHLFSPEHWRRCVHVRAAGSSWDKLFDAYRVNLVVVEAERNPALCDVLRNDRRWIVCTDEAGTTAKIDPRCRLFVALRAAPLPPLPLSAVQ
jgi:hypothetical protein